jgi:small subunit ribosomal protein S16
MVKIRLARRGRKGKPFYNIVIADARAPRDGRFIEKVGTYDPVAGSGCANIKADRVVTWLFQGAQPTDTVRRLCTLGGVMLVKHLMEGVKKGAITKTIAQERFSLWKKMVEKRVKKRIEVSSSVDVTSLIESVSATQAKATTAGKKAKNKAQGGDVIGE